MKYALFCNLSLLLPHTLSTTQRITSYKLTTRDRYLLRIYWKTYFQKLCFDMLEIPQQKALNSQYEHRRSECVQTTNKGFVNHRNGDSHELTQTICMLDKLFYRSPQRRLWDFQKNCMSLAQSYKMRSLTVEINNTT